MAEILLTHCNHVYSDRKQIRKMQPYPPLQTLIAAAMLRRHGYEVALFDPTLDPPEEGFREALGIHRPRVVAICEDNFNFLTKMCLLRNRELAFTMSRIAGEAGIPVIVNASDATDRTDLYLAQGIDYVMVGEVEQTLVEICDRLCGRGGRAPEEIEGLAFRGGDGSIHRTPPRPRLEHLDGLPSPAWELTDLEKYRAAWLEAHGYFSLNLVSSRGCPYHCNWCAKPIYGQAYTQNSPERVAHEMLRLKNEYRPDHLWFGDDIFALSGAWTLRFARAVEDLRAAIPFKMQSRCDLMTRDTVEALRRSGCEEVWMGAESGSQKILDAMDKGTRVEQIYEARENLRRHGIRACYFLQFGYPGETWEDIRKTVRMVRETGPDEIGVSVSYPLPGTVFYERVAAQLGAKRNWSDSDDLAMMFRSGFTNEFYHALHDALHLELDLERSGTDDPAGRLRLGALWAQVEALKESPAKESENSRVC